MILEVCVDSFKSLMTAQKAGADRIELCSALDLGGLTPSYGLMSQAREVEGLEIFAMVRPRPGDFVYAEEEFETMKRDVAIIKEMGFHGIVAGFLHRDGRIDLEKTRELLEEAKPLKFVFHRAFDEAKNPERDVESLIDLGVIRILTSGQRESALEGADCIRTLEERYGKRITIMPGAGIHGDNIEELHKKVQCAAYHMSGKTDRGTYREADYEKIKAVREILDGLDQ